MSFEQTVVLGALAGFTIYLGLPLGRINLVGKRSRLALAMFSAGILAFIFVDVCIHAFEIVEGSVAGYKSGHNGIDKPIFLALLLGIGFTAGCAGLAFIEQRLRGSDTDPPPIAGGSVEAAVVDTNLFAQKARTDALRTGMAIAIGIGIHNFAEGLAIGVSARAGEIALATVLIIGFALHNATEGFGIIGPLSGVRPSWRWLALAGLVGGGPTFLGSIVGYNVQSNPLELIFFAVAGGAILYVIGEIWHSVRRLGHKELGLVFLSVGFMAGILTDLVVAYGGG